MAGSDRPDAGPTLLAAEPQLFVGSIAAACGFYVRKLGFAVAFTYGDPPFYAQVVCGGARLNLRQVDGPVFDDGFRDRQTDALSATVPLDDAEALFREYQRRALPSTRPCGLSPGAPGRSSSATPTAT